MQQLNISKLLMFTKQFLEKQKEYQEKMRVESRKILSALEHLVNDEPMVRNKGFQDIVDVYEAGRKQDKDISFILGICYAHGRGVEKNVPRAFEYFFRAEAQGSSLAALQLGIGYRMGVGVEKDLKKSAYYYQKSVDQGLIIAHYMLKFCYQKGMGVVADQKRGEELFDIALQATQTEIIEEGLGVGEGEGCTLGTQAEVRLAKIGCIFGHPDSFFVFGYYLEHGIVVKKNVRLATAYYRMAANGLVLGAITRLQELSKIQNRDACLELGYIFKYGWGVVPNANQAIHYFEQYISSGTILGGGYREGNDYCEAHRELSLLYNELGTEADSKKSRDHNNHMMLSYVLNHYQEGKRHIEPGRENFNKALVCFSEVCGAASKFPLIHDIEGDNEYRIAYAASLVYLASLSEQGWGEIKEAFRIRELYQMAWEIQRFVDPDNIDLAEPRYSIGFYYLTKQDMADDHAKGFSLLKLTEKLLSVEYKVSLLLGISYLEGKGVEPDLALAREYLFEYCNQYPKDPVGHYYLGIMYFDGKGVEKDRKRAFEYLNYAYEQGVQDAHFYLGVLYYENQAVGLDPEKMLMHFEHAVRMGHPEAHSYMGIMYEFKSYYEPDIKKAVDLYQFAVARGCPIAKYALSLCYRHGRGLEPNLDIADSLLQQALEHYVQHPKALAEADHRKIAVFNLYINAASYGHLEASHCLGVCFEKGIGVEVDDKRAIALYTVSATRGLTTSLERLDALIAEKNVYAMLTLAREYYHCNPKNYVKTVELLEEGVRHDSSECLKDLICLAREKNIPLSQYRLGVLLAEGVVITSGDIKEDVEFLRIAVEQGNAKAMYKMAQYYFLGLQEAGIKVDWNASMRLLEESSKQGCQEANYFLGWCHENGLGVAFDRLRALKFYQMAANEGNIEAMMAVAVLQAKVQAQQPKIETLEADPLFLLQPFQPLKTKTSTTFEIGRREMETKQIHDRHFENQFDDHFEGKQDHEQKQMRDRHPNSPLHENGSLLNVSPKETEKRRAEENGLLIKKLLALKEQQHQGKDKNVVKKDPRQTDKTKPVILKKLSKASNDDPMGKSDRLKKIMRNKENGVERTKKKVSKK